MTSRLAAFLIVLAIVGAGGCTHPERFAQADPDGIGGTGRYAGTDGIGGTGFHGGDEDGIGGTGLWAAAGAQYRDADEAARAAAASDVFRQILIERYRQYRSKGLDGIEGYKRSKRKTIDIGRELHVTTDAFEAFDSEFPEFVRTATS